MISYTRLKSGDWGIRADAQLKPGASVEVTTKAGIPRQETVGNAIWNDGKVWLYAIKRDEGGLEGECANCGKTTILVQNAPDSNGLLSGVCAACAKLHKSERSYA